MAPARRLSELAEPKRLLVLRADLNRALLRAEGVKARQRLERLTLAGGKASEGPWALAVAALGGWVAARHWRKVFRWGAAALAAWREIGRR